MGWSRQQLSGQKEGAAKWNESIFQYPYFISSKRRDGQMGTFYENNPDLQYYFENLPIAVKNKILESGANPARKFLR